MQSNLSVKNTWKKLKQSSILGALVAFVVVVIVMSVASNTFFTKNNLTNLIRQGAVLSVVAIAQSLVIITGGIDLSVAPVVSLSTVLTASLITDHGMNWVLAALIAIVACMLCGTINGVLVTFVKIPPIIATLATSMAYQGLCLLYTKGYGINLPAENGLTALIGRGKLLGIPVSGYIIVVIYAIFLVVMKYTMTGRVTYGLGGNSEAVYLSGVSTNKYRVRVYLLSGMLAGIAGVMLTARLNGGHPYNGEGFDMDSVASSVLGGISVAGGTGSLGGTLLGVFILTMITNGLNMINMNTYVQMMIKGLIIVLAIGFGCMRSKKK